MDVQKLRTFVTLADAGSYSEAAERLYMTQSNVSKQIQSLEKELGDVLVDRTRRNIRFTEAGQTVLRHARYLLADYDGMMSELAGKPPILPLAALPVMAHYGIPTLLAAFQQTHPEIELSVEEVEGILMPEALAEGKYELAFLRTLPGEEEGCYEKQVLCRDRLVAVLPRQHPLAGRAGIHLEELAGERLAMLAQSSTLYGLITNACHLAGFTPNICYTGRRMENILELVVGGFGCSLLMERATVYVDNARVRLVPLEEKIISEVSLMRLKGRHSTPAERFWTFCTGKTT